jgi:hypothetical protein
MVGLQAMVLGRLGIKPRSSSKGVCSILPIAICGPGLYGAPASIMLPLAALVSPHRTWRGLRFAPLLNCRGFLMYRFIVVYIRNIIPGDMGGIPF